MLDRLPDSVIHHILSYAIPPPTPRSISRRYRLLLQHSRLARSWARVAQTLLFKHVDIEDELSARRFIHAVEACPRARRLAFTKTETVRLSRQKYALGGEFVEQVLRRTPGAKCVSLERLAVNPLGLSFAASCEKLHLFDCELTETKVLDEKHKASSGGLTRETWHLPRLTSLTFSCSYFVTRENYWIPLPVLLNRLALPALTSLAFVYHDESSAPEMRLVAAQLTSLWLRRIPRYKQQPNQRRDAQPEISALPQEDLAFCSSSLVHLAVDIHKAEDFKALRALGTASLASAAAAAAKRKSLELGHAAPPGQPQVLLRTLRLESPYLTAAERELIAQSLPALSALEELIVSDLSPPSTSSSSAAASSTSTAALQTHRSARSAIRAEADARGFALSEVRFQHPEGGYEALRADMGAWEGACERVDGGVAARAAEAQEQLEEDEDEPVIEAVWR
ncbi:hypothetical protein JCM6882_006252 [Rhodosporidiobolus microsporus]